MLIFLTKRAKISIAVAKIGRRNLFLLSVKLCYQLLEGLKMPNGYSLQKTFLKTNPNTTFFKKKLAKWLANPKCLAISDSQSQSLSFQTNTNL